MNIRTLAVNGVLAALYIAVTMIIQPFSFTNIQFRVPEMFNHLIVFNKKYFIGIVIGVFFSNLFFSSLGVYDLLFGVGQSVLALSMTILIARFVKNICLASFLYVCPFEQFFLLLSRARNYFRLPPVFSHRRGNGRHVKRQQRRRQRQRAHYPANEAQDAFYAPCRTERQRSA